jgi:hypothetical protein
LLFWGGAGGARPPQYCHFRRSAMVEHSPAHPKVLGSKTCWLVHIKGKCKSKAKVRIFALVSLHM